MGVPVTMKKLAILFALLPAATAPAADAPPVEETRMHWGTATVYMENDKFFAGSDRHYTNGFKISALSRDLSDDLGEAPSWASQIVRWLPTHKEDRPGRKIGFAIGQNIFTPENIETTALVPDDRPYAGWLYGSLAVHRQTYGQLDVFEVSLGVVGESALGRQIQNGWHKIIDVDEVKGWDNQLRDEPGLIIAYEHRRRFKTVGSSTGWGADFIPHAGVSLGNVDTHLAAGAQARFGWRLPSDFGHAPIRPGGDSNTHLPFDLTGWAIHGFAGLDARFVARNIFLDGNTWKDSHSIDKREFAADLFGGFSLRFDRFRFDYTQVYRTKEFYGQGRRDVFGSLAITVLY